MRNTLIPVFSLARLRFLVQLLMLFVTVYGSVLVGSCPVPPGYKHVF